MIASSPILATSLPQKHLTTSASVARLATGGEISLPLPEKLAIVLDKSESIDEVQQIHASVLRRNLFLHPYHPVLNLKLHRAYASHGKVRQSLSLFHETIDPDLFLFTAAINTASINGLRDQAFLLYVQLLSSEIVPNEFTFSSILKSCSAQSVKAIHTHVLKVGLGLDPYVGTGLVDVYAMGGDVVSAQKLFDRMPERSLVSSTAMITCYARQGNVEAARALFEGMSERDIVSWNVMIDGYAQHGFPSEALILFQKLLAKGNNPKPDEITAVASLSACSQIGALESGRWIHLFIKKSRIRFNVKVCTALIDMYSKCGSLEEAVSVFNDTPTKDIVAWNAMITGYAMHGYSQDALRLFDEMRGIAGLQPTDITFIATLQACAHAGLVKKGVRMFESMGQVYGIKPKIEHYGCLVSLLGRAGQLKQAYEIIKKMEIESDSVVWSSLLGSCKLHGDFVLGKEIAEYLIGRNITNLGGTYVLLSNIYASGSDYEGVAKVRSLMKEKSIVKEPGISTIEIDDKVHEFRAGDRNHLQSKEIYTMVRKMSGWIESSGYVPDTNAVLQDLEETEKEQSLEVHSERLAIAYGLISTKPGSPLRIFKNLRVCSDCHTVTKLISKITGRKIVMRDRNRFHHFVNGSCSCGDFW